MKEYLPSIITLALVAISGAFGYGKLKQEVKEMKGDVEKMEVNHKDDLEKMESAHKEDIASLNDRLDKMDLKNSDQHKELFTIGNETKTMVARLEGYWLGANDKTGS